jgi:hypothetical protein
LRTGADTFNVNASSSASHTSRQAGSVPVQSVTDYFPTPSISSRNVVWAEELAELIDASVVELSDVITVTTAAIAVAMAKPWGCS